MDQKFSSLKYGNCRDPCAKTDGVFSKSQFREKNPVLPVEKFSFLVLARDTMMLQHLIIHLAPFFVPLSVKWTLTGG